LAEKVAIYLNVATLGIGNRFLIRLSELLAALKKLPIILNL